MCVKLLSIWLLTNDNQKACAMLITFCTHIISAHIYLHNWKGKDYHRCNYIVFFYAIILANVLYASPT